MNKVIMKAKNNVVNQKKKYLFLATIMSIGIISGIIFIFFISEEDKSLVKQELDIFFAIIKDGKFIYTNSIINSVGNNLLYLVIIWVLGISIVGIPIIVFLLFLKGFIFGFSISSVVVNYGLKGLIMGIITQFPHNVILLITFILIGFYAINFSIHLFQVLFFKKDLNLSLYFKRYNQIALISLGSIVLCSIIETFMMPFLIKFFL